MTWGRFMLQAPGTTNLSFQEASKPFCDDSSFLNMVNSRWEDCQLESRGTWLVLLLLFRNLRAFTTLARTIGSLNRCWGKPNNKATSGQGEELLKGDNHSAPHPSCEATAGFYLSINNGRGKSWTHSSKTSGTWKLQAGLRVRASLHTQHCRHYRSWKRNWQVPVCWDTTVQEISCSLFPKEYHTKRHSILWLGWNTWIAPPNPTLLVSHMQKSMPEYIKGVPSALFLMSVWS